MPAEAVGHGAGAGVRTVVENAVAPPEADVSDSVPCVGSRHVHPCRGRSGRRDLLGAVEDLAALVPGDHLDVMDLDRAGPVARVEALTKGEVLLETRRGAFTEREMSALGEYLETAYLRDALLRELAR